MFSIIILEKPISIAELKKIAEGGYGNMVKGVVDVELEALGIGGELHVDIESELRDKVGGVSNDKWGINLYPEQVGEEFLEFDSMVNLKPAVGNRTRGVENPEVREKIKKVVDKFILK